MNTKRITMLSLISTIGLAIYLVESALPLLIPIPGVKIGLANVITLLLLTYASPLDALLALLLRILLGSLLTGNFMGLLYSMAGGLCSFFIMLVCHRILPKKQLILISCIGSLFHNFGQLLIALLLTESASVLLFVPYLILAGIVTGILTGICAVLLAKYLHKPLTQMLHS